MLAPEGHSTKTFIGEQLQGTDIIVHKPQPLSSNTRGAGEAHTICCIQIECTTIRARVANKC